MKKRAEKSVERTFQVAVYGPAGAGKATTLRALHAQASNAGPLVEIPSIMHGGGTTVFFDAQPLIDRGLRATLRLRAITGTVLSGQAFLSLFRSDALVLVHDATRARDNLAAWKAATDHFAMYKVDPQRLPIVVQLTHLDRPHAARAVETAKDAPRVETNPTTGEGIADLARTIERTVLDAFHDGRAEGCATTAPSPKYVERAEALAAAADIATAIRGDDPWAFELATKQMALHPGLGFAKLSSLASLESAFFTYWNEASGRAVEAFWSEVARRGLPFQRRDVVAEVLARGRITNREDYDTVTDRLGSDELSAEQKTRLSSMLGAYEASASRKRKR
ncbi:gliding motility protein MglA [Minicystis rosea]|nr:gliding motility protein MglA [Minicystis rosea]